MPLLINAPARRILSRTFTKVSRGITFLMNRPGQPITRRLPLLSHLPEPADLLSLMQLAQNYPGEQIEVSWNLNSYLYTLVAQLPAPGGKNAGRQSYAVEWTLLSCDMSNGRKTQVWKHTSSDAEFITSFLAVLPGASSGKITELQAPSAAPAFGQPPRRSPSHENAAAPAGVQPLQNPSSTVPGRPEPGAAPQTADMTAGMTLSGDLSEVELVGILQSVALLRMTGCLEVHDRLDEAFLFFDEGILVHAAYETTLASEQSGITGDRVLLELLLWSSGQFSFRPGKKVPEKSVNRRLDALLTEGASLKEYWKYLLANGMELEANVSRTRANLSREEFDCIVGQGLPIELGLQQRVYLEVNGRRTLQDIISKYGLPRLVWVPVIYNLHNSKLISFSSTQLKSESRRQPPCVPDNLTLSQARSRLTRIESGMMTYELFYHFLLLEFERAKKQNSHFFSVIVFSIHDLKTREPLSILSVGKITEYIEQAKEGLDILAHFRDSDFVMLCPYRDVQQAGVLAEKVVNSLKQCSLQGMQFEELRLAFGVAGTPQNCTNPVQLLGLAEAARDLALSENRLIAFSNNRTA